MTVNVFNPFVTRDEYAELQNAHMRLTVERNELLSALRALEAEMREWPAIGDVHRWADRLKALLTEHGG